MKLKIWLSACTSQAHSSVTAKWEQAEMILLFSLLFWHAIGNKWVHSIETWWTLAARGIPFIQEIPSTERTDWNLTGPQALLMLLGFPPSKSLLSFWHAKHFAGRLFQHNFSCFLQNCVIQMVEQCAEVSGYIKPSILSRCGSNR